MKMRTKLTIAECRKRLGSATDLGGMALSWDSNGPGPVVGEFRGAVFRLHTKKYYKNSFAPFLYGKLTEEDGGTTVEGSFRMHPFIRLFMVFWLGMLIVFGAGALIVTPPAQPGGQARFFAGIVALALGGGVLMLTGKWLGRGDTEVIRTFVATTLEAKDVEAS
jgi:hypothetical protein